jgi:uncharacterized protein (DUF736 family)
VTDYDNTNSGALFKNKEKLTEKHPDYKGSLNVDGDEFWVSAWLKTSKKGEKYMSLSIKPKEEQADRAPARTVVRQQMDDPDESIPF